MSCTFWNERYSGDDLAYGESPSVIPRALDAQRGFDQESERTDASGTVQQSTNRFDHCKNNFELTGATGARFRMLARAAKSFVDRHSLERHSGRASSLLVDGHDFLIWQRSLRSTSILAGSGADGDMTGVVDTNDLLVLSAKFSVPGQPPALFHRGRTTVILGLALWLSA